MAAWFAHLASYVVGAGGGVLLLLQFWRERGRPRVLPFFPESKSGAIRVVILAGCVVALIFWRAVAP